MKSGCGVVGLRILKTSFMFISILRLIGLFLVMVIWQLPGMSLMRLAMLNTFKWWVVWPFPVEGLKGKSGINKANYLISSAKSEFLRYPQGVSDGAAAGCLGGGSGFFPWGIYNI